MTNRLNIIVGMSGGVDSSVAAALLIEQGHNVTGLFMKNWDEDDGTEYCTAIEDLADAQQVCDQLGVPLKTVNFAAEYWENVFETFLQEYRAGRTPNPDILCNKEIKFKAFLDYAKDLGADFIATGHYTRIDQKAGEYRLLKGIDSNKDQSYFLYTLGQVALSKTLFPIGELEKPEVRRLAEKYNFDNSRKKDSTGICFIGERKFRDFLKRYIPAQLGEMHDSEGSFIGNHQGLMYYTLGQRRGLDIGGRKNASEEPWYVVDKDLKNNILIVAQGHNHPLLFKTHLEATNLDWVTDKLPESSLRCRAKIRYRQQDQNCLLEIISKERCRVTFDEPQRAMTPGQSVVFYLEEQCLGGGVIEVVYNLPEEI